MSVPASVKARREQILAEHGDYAPASSIDVDTDPAIQAAEPAPAPAPNVSADIDDTIFDDPGQNVPSHAPQPSPQDAQWEQRYRSLQGMFDAKNAQIDLLKQRLEALEAAAKAPPAPTVMLPPAPAAVQFSLPDVPAITAEQQATYANAIPVVRRLAADLLSETLGPVLARIAQLEGQVAQVDQATQTTQSAVAGVADSSFKAALRAAVPDLGAISKMPAFTAFLATPVPYSGGLTVRDRLKAAYDARNIPMIVSIIGDYRASKPAVGQTPTPAHFQQPGGQGGQPPATPEPQAKPKLPWSAREEASVKFRKKQISAAEMQQISALYEQAAKEGRIDMNA